MSNERAILCGNSTAKAPVAGGPKPLRLRLWGRSAEVNLKSDDLSRPVSTNIPSTFADLLEIATYIYCADQAITRGGDGVDNAGQNWRRQLRFTIPVRNAGFWRKPDVMIALQETLSFLSEDEYEFEFCDLVDGPTLQHYLPFSTTGTTAAPEEVVLFSGGLDSLGGAVQEAVVNKRPVALVNHRPTEKLSRRYQRLQQLLAQHAVVAQPMHIPVHINKKKSLGREYTQRTRSFLYASLAAVIAEMYGLCRIRFYENGVVSLNLPLSAQVVGAKATRTTHPRVIKGFSRVLSAVAGKNFDVENPYAWKTKAEVLRDIVNAQCGELIKYATSCTHTWTLTKLKTHCGTCSQCIDRRFAVLAAAAEANDPADAYGVDLLLGPRAVGEPRTMLAAYVETASEITKLSATEFFSRYGEVGRALRHLDGSPDLAAFKIYELHKRHSKQVVEVVDGAISKHATAIRNRELPESCLLRLVCDTAVPVSVEQATNATIIRSEPQLALGDYAFRKKGSAWVVRFNRREEFILLPSKGAAYLHLLLASPTQSLSAVGLAFQVARQPANFVLGDAGERSDKEAHAAYRACYQDLQDEMATAVKNGDEATVERLRGEITALADELKDRGWGGRPKKQHDDRDRVRKAVGIAIRRAVEQIAKYDRAFADHLKPPRLNCGNNPCYDPGTTIAWDL
ncbi:MAG: hypothetical protein U1D55_11195 [Phycisphaerae bacterium]